MEFQILPLDRIRPSPFQPRETFPKEEIEELSKSIKASDLLQPILVRKKGENYEIIAGERRWRAAQFANLEKIPAIIREANDDEARELSLIENWHRLALQTKEAESFIFRLYKNGLKSSRYKSVNDMAKKTGIPEGTLREIITAQKEKNELGIRTGANLTYTDLRETRIIKEQPELRKQVLELRERGKLSRDELREFSKVVTEVSEPVRKALLREDLKLAPEEALVIDTELITPEEKIRAIEEIGRERTPDRVKRLVRVIRNIEEMRKEIELVKEIDTGDIWLCPVCKKKFHLTHVEPSKSHRFEEVIE